MLAIARHAQYLHRFRVSTPVQNEPHSSSSAAAALSQQWCGEWGWVPINRWTDGVYFSRTATWNGSSIKPLKSWLRTIAAVVQDRLPHRAKCRATGPNLSQTKTDEEIHLPNGQLTHTWRTVFLAEWHHNLLTSRAINLSSVCLSSTGILQRRHTVRVNGRNDMGRVPVDTGRRGWVLCSGKWL